MFFARVLVPMSVKLGGFNWTAEFLMISAGEQRIAFFFLLS
jgi:hypothetical protein